jgi:hypothetical protein
MMSLAVTVGGSRATAQALAYVYFEEGPGRRSAAHLLTRDEARRVAVAHIPILFQFRIRIVFSGRKNW